VSDTVPFGVQPTFSTGLFRRLLEAVGEGAKMAGPQGPLRHQQLVPGLARGAQL
jgi:hypothetical protein